MGFSSCDHAWYAPVDVHMPRNEVRSGKSVAIQKDQHVTGGKFSTGIGST
jgi:hypothetical protein